MNKANGTGILIMLGSILLILVGLWLIVPIFNSHYGMNFGFRGGNGGGDMYMGTQVGFGIGTISGLLILLIKFLFVLFIVGLAIGIVVAIKKYVFTKEDIQKIKGTFTDNKTVIKKVCSDCGKEVDEEWTVCPFCRVEIKKN